MDWSLCIATLNRRDALLRALRHALAQTRPPRDVVVIDASDDWEENARLAQEIFAAYPGIDLTYRTSEVRSSSTQRNLGVSLCRGDIVFMLDDDSFMFPDCAEEVMKIYEADKAGEVACISINQRPDLPPLPGEARGPEIAQKQSGQRSMAGLRKLVMRNALGRWFNRKVLMQSMDEMMIAYEGPRDAPVPASVAGMDVGRVTYMQGCAMTARRAVALREPFDTTLRYYAAGEDADAAYRYGRHGVALWANRAYLHHFEAAGGRIKRKKVIIFQLLNMAVFIKRNAAEPERWKGAYQVPLLRRLFGEFLKDGLSRRFDFPQVKGVLTAMRNWRAVWNHDTADLENWYPALQKRIIEDL